MMGQPDERHDGSEHVCPSARTVCTLTKREREAFEPTPGSALPMFIICNRLSPCALELALTHGDPHIRSFLATHQDADEGVLQFLAKDVSPVVRSSLALHGPLSDAVTMVLASDRDLGVRMNLALREHLMPEAIDALVRSSSRKVDRLLARTQLVEHLRSVELPTFRSAGAVGRVEDHLRTLDLDPDTWMVLLPHFSGTLEELIDVTRELC